MQVIHVTALSPKSPAPQPFIASEEVQQAISRREIVPYFQPKISLKSRALVGAEALLRWESSAHGLVCARTLLPAIDDRSLVDEVTTLMLERSMGEFQRWRKAGLDIQLCVNLHSRLLLGAATLDRLESIAGSHLVAPSRIIVEVPETAFADDLPEALDHLVGVRVRGFGLAVDDFGSGRCTPEQLARIPATEMKIDGNLVVHAVNDLSIHKHVQSSLTIARELNLNCVAEGIESREEWALAKELGCDFAQGSFVAEPMPGEKLIEWYRDWKNGSLN